MESIDPFDFDTLIDRRHTSSEKWDKYGDPEVMPQWLADMDFRSPPAVMEALHRRVDHGVFGYTHASTELQEVIQETLAVSYGWKIEAEWIVWLPGLVTGLNVACRAAGQDGDAVATCVPVYPPFLSAPSHFRRELVTVPMIQDSGRWIFNFDRLDKALPDRTRMFLLCNPQNPCGRVFTRQELTDLAEICTKHDLIICSDEIHCGLVLDEGKSHVPTATLDPDIASRTITLMAPSKTYNLPGLGFGYAIISDSKLRSRFRKSMAGIVPGVNAMAYTAALAAYKHGAPWLDALLPYLRTNRDLVEESVARMPGLSMTHVEATYMAWIDARPLGLEDPAAFFERAGLGLGAGHVFGMSGFVRFSFASPLKLVQEALARMRGAAEDQSSC